MGKSLELLGLAGFNVILAIIMATTFLSNSDVQRLQSLTQTNVEMFIEEVAAISSGQREDMDDYSITSYFLNHIADGSIFKTTVAYSLPGMENTTRDLEMDKLNYISHILKSSDAITRYETLTRIEYVKISGHNEATAMTTNYERGMMPVDDGMGSASLAPVTGTSYCEQKIILNEKHIIQMAGAKCTTDLVFTESY